MGAKEIVKTLNGEGLRTNKGKPWNKNYVYYILKNEKYTGTLVWNQQNSSPGSQKPQNTQDIIRVDNNHPPIVDRETFEKVQDILSERSPQKVHPRGCTNNCVTG